MLALKSVSKASKKYKIELEQVPPPIQKRMNKEMYLWKTLVINSNSDIAKLCGFSFLIMNGLTKIIHQMHRYGYVSLPIWEAVQTHLN